MLRCEVFSLYLNTIMIFFCVSFSFLLQQLIKTETEVGF